LPIIAGILAWKYPPRATLMSNLVWIIPCGLFLAFWIFNLAVRAPYIIYKNQQKELIAKQNKIESLLKKNDTMFFKETKRIIKALESNISELDDYFKNLKYYPKDANRDLRRVLEGNTLVSFIPTDRNSNKYKSLCDAIEDVLIYLMDYKPNIGNDIKKRYENVRQQLYDILTKCQTDESRAPHADVLGFKNHMQELINTVSTCEKIVKEERTTA
jgi:dimeric dUTPase (all-alpha-NTP-PPase superfamily)